MAPVNATLLVTPLLALSTQQGYSSFALPASLASSVFELSRSYSGLQAVPSCRVTGFRGWLLTDYSSGNSTIFRGVWAIDKLLLSDTKISALERPVLDHIREEAKRLAAAPNSDERCAALSNEMDGNEIERGEFACCSNPPVVGPDDPTEIHYDKSGDLGGCFVCKQSDNNCYNYGNDIASNTFAQPGRGSGVCSQSARPCVHNDCDAVRAAAESDGLKWVGTTLPTVLPDTGHYVSLHIWPNQNFHWLRMDADLKWSHKPGGSAVRNVDNNYNLITDPAVADVSPWSQHCGYMHTTPSTVQIY